VNTVIFGTTPPKGYNTDYSGFIAAYRLVRGAEAPGPTLMIGAGGVGKAVAFGLIALGATEIRIVDRDLPKAEALAAALTAAAPGLVTRTGTEAEALATGATGLINCTPVGMVGYDGTPLAPAAMTGAEWAFDAVYTPVDTQFLKDAEVAGLRIISGYELFFGQGVDAWRIFTGLPLDSKQLRADLKTPEE
jgi:shikimate dehydrogenase